MTTRRFLGILAIALTYAMAIAQRGATHRIVPAGRAGAFDLYVDIAPGDTWNAAEWRMTSFQGVTIETPVNNNPFGPWQPPLTGFPGPYPAEFDTFVIAPGNPPLGLASILHGSHYTPTDAIVTWFEPPPSGTGRQDCRIGGI